jgi:hypothetical protein
MDSKRKLDGKPASSRFIYIGLLTVHISPALADAAWAFIAFPIPTHQ